ncbi:MAG: hypothetical protein U0M72_02035 [Eggerthellaceae bacterium]
MEVFETLIPVGIVLLCLAGVVALCAMAYMFMQLSKTAKETMVKVNPLLDDAKVSLERANALMEQVDPIMERLTLTIDAANLEIMRVDQILEDVNTITGNVSKATESLDVVTSLPFDAISSVTSRLRQRIAPLGKKECAYVSNAANAIDQTLDTVEGKVANAQAQADVKRAARDEAFEKRDAAQDQANEMSSNLKDAFSTQIASDTESV